MNALELANALEVSDKHPELINVNNRAAAELRRLHEVNQELLGELKTILDYHTTSKPWHAKDGDMSVWIKSARNAINKATGESK